MQTILQSYGRNAIAEKILGNKSWEKGRTEKRIDERWEVMISRKEKLLIKEDIKKQSPDCTRLKRHNESNYLGVTFAEEGETKRAVRLKVKKVSRNWKEGAWVKLEEKIPLKLRMNVTSNLHLTRQKLGLSVH